MLCSERKEDGCGKGSRVTKSHLWEARSEQAGFCSVSAAGQQNWCSTVSFLWAEWRNKVRVWPGSLNPVLWGTKQPTWKPAALSLPWEPLWNPALGKCAALTPCAPFTCAEGSLATLEDLLCTCPLHPCRKLLPTELSFFPFFYCNYFFMTLLPAKILQSLFTPGLFTQDACS